LSAKPGIGVSLELGADDIDEQIDTDSDGSSDISSPPEPQSGNGARMAGAADLDQISAQGPAEDAIDQDVGIIPRFLFELFDRLSDEAMDEIERNGVSRYGDPSPTAEVRPTGSLDRIDRAAGTTTSFELRVSMVEVYGEVVRDLLASTAGSSSVGEPSNSTSWQAGPQTVETGLSLREGPGGVEVVGLESQEVSSASEALDYLEQGVLRRATGATKMNVHSSRSHAIYTIELEKRIVTHNPS